MWKSYLDNASNLSPALVDARIYVVFTEIQLVSFGREGYAHLRR